MDQVVKHLERFRNQRVLVTGHTGFKGAWLTHWLIRIGADVSGISLPNGDNSMLATELNIIGRTKSYAIDIRDRLDLFAAFSEIQPKVVFHLAAQPLVQRSYLDPHETFTTNVIGSVNILDAAFRTQSVRSLVYVTSDKCYENQERLEPYVESDRLGGHDPYSASKAAAEIVFHSYLKSFINRQSRLGAASVRSGNVIGGGDWSNDRLIPDLVRSIRDKTELKLRHPNSVRPWQHVLDPLYGYLLLAANLLDQPHEYAGSWNFGPDFTEVVSVQNVVSKFLSSWGNFSVKPTHTTSDVHEAGILTLNSNKAREHLDWRPIMNFQKAIDRTAYWYRGLQQEGMSAHHLCNDDIEWYEKELKRND